MAVRYTGEQPTRITRYSAHKNTTRWMYVPKQKYETSYGAKYWLSVIGITITAVTMLAFVWLANGG